VFCKKRPFSFLIPIFKILCHPICNWLYSHTPATHAPKKSTLARGRLELTPVRSTLGPIWVSLRDKDWFVEVHSGCDHRFVCSHYFSILHPKLPDLNILSAHSRRTMTFHFFVRDHITLFWHSAFTFPFPPNSQKKERVIPPIWLMFSNSLIMQGNDQRRIIPPFPSDWRPHCISRIKQKNTR